MEFKKKPQSSVPAAKLPKSVSQAVKPAVPVQRLSVERLSVQRAIQEHTSRPVTVQRQVVQPALRAADLHTQENKRLAVQREALQREAAALGPISPEAITQAVQRQQAPAPPVPMKPQSVGDWVTVMRFQAEQAQGRMMQTREAMQYTALQRQVANTIAQNFRQDRQPASARHHHYAGHLATLQRSPASVPVAAVALQLMPAGERPAVQRALDEVLQREAEQQAQDAQAMKLHSLQRQLDELEQEATRPVMQRIQQRRGSGNPLPEAVQRHLEQGLNHDLSAVRIHDDQEADKMAQKVNAVAFTTGQDIYFRAGKFNPNSQSGLELLAHEVTHTVQQARGEVGPGIDPSASHEAQARDMGRKMSATSVNHSKSQPQKRPAPGMTRAAVRQNTLQKAPADKAPPQVGTTKVHPDVALKMLESYTSTGKFNFKPELGKGGASWFVTKGNPYVGIDASKNIPIEVEMAISKDAVVFKEVDLLNLLKEVEAEQKAALESEWVRRKGRLPANSAERNEFKRFSQKFNETKMWDKVAGKIKASGKGIGRVILEKSIFSKSGDGEFAVVTDSSKLKVKTSVADLIGTLNKSGYVAEKPIQEASEKLLKAERIKGTIKGVYRYGGRVLLVVAVAADTYRIYHAKDKKLAVVESVGGWAGATAAGSAFAAWFTPADVAGWPAWVVHGVGTLVAGGIGYWAGSKTTRTIYQLTLEGK